MIHNDVVIFLSPGQPDHRLIQPDDHRSYTYRYETWVNSRENIKTSVKESLGLHELKRHKPWFDKNV